MKHPAVRRKLESERHTESILSITVLFSIIPLKTYSSFEDMTEPVVTVTIAVTLKT